MTKTDSWPKIINLLSEVVVYDSVNFEQFLKKLIKLITQVIPVDSCLIYFYDRGENKLNLIASKKTHKNLLGKISLQKGEGITGWVATHQKAVVLPKKAYEDERFKSFSELPEDKYEAFLSVPIIDKEGVIGVINLQNRTEYDFTKEQIGLIESLVKIIASAFEKVVLERQVTDLQEKLEERKVIEKAKGILMKEKKISENEAFQLIRKEAMRKRKTMKEIAEAMLLVFG
jgi:uroporphyrinogen-III synthase